MRTRHITLVRAFRDALWLVVVPLYGWMLVRWRGSIGTDSAHAYWNARIQDLYHASPGSLDAYNYSPAFAQVIRPLTLLPWEAFLVIWSALLCGALLWLLWPLGGQWRWLTFLYAAPPAVAIGNIEPLLAVVAVVGLSHPGVWAFALLTKVTPGLGPLWFAVRGEWRNASVALFVTCLIVGVSLAANPQPWVDWLGFLRDNSGIQSRYLPLSVRFPLAMAILVWGARRNRPAAIGVAMAFAMPLWSAGVVLLLAAVPRLRLGSSPTPVPDPEAHFSPSGPRPARGS